MVTSNKGIVFTLDVLLSVFVALLFISSFYYIRNSSYEKVYWDKAVDTLTYMDYSGIFERLNQSEINSFFSNFNYSYRFILDCDDDDSKILHYELGDKDLVAKFATYFFTVKDVNSTFNYTVNYSAVYETNYTFFLYTSAAYVHEVYINVSSPNNNTVRLIDGHNVVVFPDGQGTYLLTDNSHEISGHALDLIVEGEENTTIVPFIYVLDTGEWISPGDVDEDTGKPFVLVVDYNNGTIYYGFEDLKGQNGIDWDYNDVEIWITQNFKEVKESGTRYVTYVDADFLYCRAKLGVSK